MKKRLFNSKKRMFVAIAVVILFSYLVTIAIVCFLGVNDIENEFQNFYSGPPISNDYYYEEIYNGEYHTRENVIPDDFDYETSFPSAIALYDKNGDLVHTNGTLIMFYDDDLGYSGLRYCYLDEFLSEEDFNAILEFQEKNKSIDIKSFKYYQSDEGEIIPVECVFERVFQKNPADTLKIVLNDNYTGKLRQQVLGEDKYLHFYLYEQLYDVSKSQDKLYRELIEYVKSDEVKSRVYENFLEWLKNNDGSRSFGGGGGSDNYHSYDMYIKINGEPYFVITCAQYDMLPHLWHEYSYIFIFVLVFFSVLGIVAIKLTAKYFDKARELDETKIAFISAITHEMKTPIAIIQNQCECVLENIAPEKNTDYLKSIYDETQKMNKLVTDVLQYNRIAQTDKLTLEKCNLSEIVKEETEKYKKQFDLHEKTVTLNIKETAIVKCDKNLIALVVDNMLSNTIKHSGSSGEVIVTVKDNIEGYKVIVYNSGSTVPEDEKDKIWSVLYKTDKSRTDRDKSSGVGLAVSAKILDLHKADYGCANVKDGVEFYFNIK